MDKVLPIFVKNVQWIALGIGALFLALMAYKYLAKTPGSVEIGGKLVAAGDVDPAVKESVTTKKLKEQIAGGTIPEPKMPEASNQLSNVLTPVKLTPIAVDNKVPVAPTADAPDGASVPKAPKPTYSDRSSGWGLYQWARHVLATGAPAVAAGGIPGDVGAGAGAAAVQMEQREFGWWTGKFEVSMEQLSAEMKAAKLDPLNPVSFKTAFLGVEAFRQEKDLAGNWGKETPVAILPEFAPLMKSLPKETASVQEKNIYMFWAAQPLQVQTLQLSAVQMLMQPPFPNVVAGDPWFMPGGVAPGQLNPGENPGVPQPMPIQPQPAVPGFQPGRPPIRPQVRPGGPEASVPFDLPGGVMLTSGGVPPRGFTSDEGAVPGNQLVPPNYGDNPGAGVGSGPIPGMGDPDGVFNPALVVQAQGLAASVSILVHDITVQPGKTYRYKVRYFIRNPLFNSQNKNLKKAAKEHLSVASEFSDWSKDYTVPARVEFWVVNVNEPRPGVIDSADFEVYVALPTGWKQEKIKVTPGDQIAKGTGDSGWSVVDIRKLKDKNYEVLLADANGVTQRRDVTTDTEDPARHVRAGVPEVPAAPGGGPAGGIEGGAPPVAPRRPVNPGKFTPDS